MNVGFWEIRSIIKKFWRNFNDPNKFQSIYLRTEERKVRREQEKRNGGLSVGNKKFHIWSEGYSITGNSSEAIYLGEFEADTFEHACDK